MQYQLVLHVSEVDPADFSRLLQWENVLTEYVAKFARVDGHDFGSDEFNVFILTNDPVATFSNIQGSAEVQSLFRPTAAAYRLIENDEYTVLWPTGQKKFHIA